MNTQGRTLVTAPTVEPITLAQAKTHLREDDDAQDAWITNAIVAAREWVEARTWRALITQTWQFTWYRFPIGRDIYIPKPPLQSVTSLTYYDTDNVLQTFAAANYIVDTTGSRGSIRLKEDQSWPETYARPGAVIAQVVAGYGSAASAVPEKYKQAMYLLVGHWYANRESVVIGTISSQVHDTVDALLDLDHARAMVG